MTKMELACSVQKRLCNVEGTGSYYTLDALNAGHEAIELLQELVYGSCDVGDVRIYKLLEEWN